MKLPERYPFQVIRLYKGEQLKPLSEEEKNEVRYFDKLYDEREECKIKMRENILDPFCMIKMKYEITKKILTRGEKIKDILLFNFIEDVARQNISDLSESMTSFIKFINECMGSHTNCFKNKSQHILIQVLINGDEEKKEDFNMHCCEIDQKREKLFGSFNSKGCPDNKSFEALKNDIEGIRLKVKTYRDKIAAHGDNEENALTWKMIDESLNRYTEILFDFYIVLSFERIPAEPRGFGIDPDATFNFLVRQIYE